MAERDRTDADADIEFDFFEDLPTTERPVREPEPARRRGGRPPMRPRRPSGTPLVRLALLIVGAIVLAVVLILWVTSCRDNGNKSSYEDYMGEVTAVVKQSDSVGQQLQSLITSRGASLDSVDTKLDGLAKQQAQAVARAQSLGPPASLAVEQQSLVDTMELRESGLKGLQQAFTQVQLATPAAKAGETLASQAARLVAADVVYEDLFKARSQEVMRQQNVSGVAVPDSSFLPTVDLVSQGSLTQFVKRLQGGGGAAGAGGAGGLHGDGVVGVRVAPPEACPDGCALSQTTETKIIPSDKLEFQVSVKNTGDFQETRVEVTLTIQFAKQPIKKTATVPLIDPGQTKTVAFTEFADLNFAQPTTLKVAVKPVPGEDNTSNNAVEYPIIFSYQ